MIQITFNSLCNVLLNDVSNGFFFLLHYEEIVNTVFVLLGLTSIPGGLIGNVIAGLILKYFKLKVTGIYKLCIISCLATACLAPILTIKCDPSAVAGINALYK